MEIGFEAETVLVTGAVRGIGRCIVHTFAATVGEIEAASPNRRVDVVVHSAGGVRGQSAKPIEEVGGDEWREIFDANVTGAFNLARAVTPGMKRVPR